MDVSLKVHQSIRKGKSAGSSKSFKLHKTALMLRSNCDHCCQAKIKCSGGLPCFLCSRRGRTCHYSLKKKPGPRTKKVPVDSMNEQDYDSFSEAEITSVDLEKAIKKDKIDLEKATANISVPSEGMILRSSMNMVAFDKKTSVLPIESTNEKPSFQNTSQLEVSKWDGIHFPVNDLLIEEDSCSLQNNDQSRTCNYIDTESTSEGISSLSSMSGMLSQDNSFLNFECLNQQFPVTIAEDFDLFNVFDSENSDFGIETKSFEAENNLKNSIHQVQLGGEMNREVLFGVTDFDWLRDSEKAERPIPVFHCHARHRSSFSSFLQSHASIYPCSNIIGSFSDDLNFDRQGYSQAKNLNGVSNSGILKEGTPSLLAGKNLSDYLNFPLGDRGFYEFDEFGGCSQLL